MAFGNSLKELGLQVLRLGLGGIFIYAGTIKALDPAQFAIDIFNYRLGPYFLAVLTALYLPWLEIFCGFAVVSRKLSQGGLWALMILTIIFILAIISAWLRGLDIHCGCFGHERSHVNYPWLVLRDLGILCGLWLLSRQLKLPRG